MWTPLPHCLSLESSTGVSTVKMRGPGLGPVHPSDCVESAQSTVSVAFRVWTLQKMTSGWTSPICDGASSGNVAPEGSGTPEKTFFSHAASATDFGMVVERTMGLCGSGAGAPPIISPSPVVELPAVASPIIGSGLYLYQTY